MAEWKFWKFADYLSPSGENPLSDWKQRILSVQQRADIDALLGILRKTRIWSPAVFRPRMRGYDELSEIRLKSDGIQIRLVGCFKPGFRYILLIGCTHKQQIYDPKDALKTAERRKRQIDRGEATFREHDESENGSEVKG